MLDEQAGRAHTAVVTDSGVVYSWGRYIVYHNIRICMYVCVHVWVGVWVSWSWSARGAGMLFLIL